MAEPRLARVRVGPDGAAEALARRLRHDLSTTAPDFSGAVVVMPNLRAAGELARVLGVQSGGPVLLPKITTLATWAAEQPAEFEPASEVVREAALFAALRSRKWFDAPNLWPLAGELSGLFAELSRFEIALPETLRQFEEALEAAYQARAGESLQLEARLVYELWRASVQPGDGPLDPVAAYQLQLSLLARAASKPMYLIGLPALIPAEQAFVDAYSLRAPVTHFEVCAGADDASARARFFAAAWPANGETRLAMRDRAAVLAGSKVPSPVVDCLRLHGAASLEAEALAAETQVRLWLSQGCEKIAVVALDRLVARRVRALLERAGIMTADETGWVFSTTSASTVLRRWLDSLSSGFYFRDLLDLVKSPFVLSGWEHRREAVYGLERAIRSESVVSGLDACRKVLAGIEGDQSQLALELVGRVEAAARLLRPSGRHGLSRWLDRLFASLAQLEVEEGLLRDPAGMQLVEYLRRLERDLGSSAETFTFGEWRGWLDQQLERAEFRDNGVSSPVIFTQLSLTRMRRFDAVALVGCDASHLPGKEHHGAFFSESVRSQLGLPTNADVVAQIGEDLSGLLCRAGRVLATWQTLRDAEPNLPSPLFERLSVFHRLVWGTGLSDDTLALAVPNARVAPPSDSALPPLVRRPAPAVPAQLLPERISASGYNSLVACPYQYYGRYVLGLRETDEVREEMEKRDYGEFVHRILRRMHGRFPLFGSVPRDDLERGMHEISESVFREATETSYLSKAWALRWQGAQSAYLDWQLAREAGGWRFLAAESKHEIEIDLPDGARLFLEGRLDRVDVSAENTQASYAVIDYKTGSHDALRRMAGEPGEDVQLPVYVALVDHDVNEAFYLSIDGDEVRPAALSADLLAEAGEAIERLREIFARIRAGASLPAQGTSSTCQWCELHGLCRKQHWHEDTSTDSPA